MTRNNDFKQLIRERMAKTGERYTTARAHLLGLGAAPPLPGVIPGYARFGGHQGDTGVIRNVLEHAGIRSPITGKPYTEAAINGLCGGPGFLYAVFEYRGWPPMLTLALRSRSMPDVYAGEGLARLGLKLTKTESTSPKPARMRLEAALDAGKAALCVVDLALLPWYGLPKEFAGAAPHVVAVVGRDGSDVWIDDAFARPMRMPSADFDRARATIRKAKHRMVVVEGADPAHDAAKAVRDAVADTARTYSEPAVPKAFQGNCGFAGMSKWRRLLTDAKDAKGWPKVFADGARAYAGLSRTYAGIEVEFTAPAGGRPFYAEFLDEAGRREPAALFRESGALWAELSRMVSESDAAVRRSCEVQVRRLELGDAEGAAAMAETAGLWRQRQKLGEECRLTAASARALYAAMADVVGKIEAVERKAVSSLT